ncbi:MAG: histidine phosphatase family protein [Anaerolineae bacterium]|nr:histidine phosphatase family protein [Anaerolineae bacterium]
MKLYFARHGESEANLLHEFSNRGRKHGLTGKGRRQAEALARRLAGTAISHLYTSPLLRAEQTAAHLSEQCGVPYTVTDALREYDCGVLEGRSDEESWVLYNKVLTDWIYHRDWKSRIEGGESFLDIKARFVPFIERLVQTPPPGACDIVLVGHGGTYRCMLPLILTNIDFDFALSHPIDHTAYVLAEPRAGGLYCVDWCGAAPS